MTLRHDYLRPLTGNGSFSNTLKVALISASNPHTIYTVSEVKGQLTIQWSLPVNDSSTSEKLLVKLTRASNLLHKIIMTRSKDAQEKRQRTT